VAVKVSGVNPIDWKTRERDDIINDQIPGHDGAGVIVAVGENVSINRVGQRVWIWDQRTVRATRPTTTGRSVGQLEEP